MGYVILGFLLIKELSQYDLLKALSKEVSPFYQPSLGSIQSGLKKLLSKDYISKIVDQSTARKKYIYTITPSGKAVFKEWMLSNFNSDKFDTEFHTKLFFLGHLDKPARKKVLMSGQDFVENILKTYRTAHEDINEQLPPSTQTDTIRYQIKTLELGICNYESLKTWLDQEIANMEV